MTGVLIERETLDTDTFTQGEFHRKMKLRDQGDTSVSRGTPKIALRAPETRGEAGTRFSLTVLRRDKADDARSQTSSLGKCRTIHLVARTTLP